MGPLLAVSYFVLKLAAYAGWCYAGIRMLDGARPGARARALGLGALRVALGLSLGLVIWYLSTRVYGALSTHEVAGKQVLTYLAVYVPVRWLEWSLMASLIERSPLAFLLPASGRSVLFRLGGIAVSCLADLPMIHDGLPVGRFMC